VRSRSGVACRHAAHLFLVEHGGRLNAGQGAPRCSEPLGAQHRPGFVGDRASRLIWLVTLAQVICPARGRWAGDAVCGLRFGRRHRAAGAHGPGLPPIRCRDCGKQSNGRSAGLPNRAQYPSNVIALVVLWRLRYRLALRDPSEMFLLHGIVFSQEAVREWEAKLAPVLAGELRRRRHGRGGARGRHWHVDETCL
jgi:hypothetical protein